MNSAQHLMENEESTIIEFELVEDLKQSYTINKDISFLDLNLKDKVETLQVGTLLKVTKKIGSPIKIISVQEVDDALISALLGE